MEVITERLVELLDMTIQIAIAWAVIMCVHRAMTRNNREPFSGDD